MFGQARPAAHRPYAGFGTRRAKILRARTAALLAGLALALGGCALRPHPLTQAQRAAEAHADLAGIFDDQKPLHGPLTLHEAFRRALAYNLDNRVKLMEIAVANNDLDISKYDMLPRLVANAGYTWRSNVDASSSQSVLTGQQSLEPSTSTDRELRLADLTLSWNILDFGVSYFTARQNANRVLVAEEQRRHVIANLLQDVRHAFWRAAAAQMLEQQVHDAIASAQSGLSTSKRLQLEALRSPLDVLRYQRTLLDLVRQLELTERGLTAAKAELASLINLPLGRRFTLAVPPMRIDRTRLPVRAMEELALLRNPDLLEASYKSRISADESRKLLLRLLPGVNLSYGPNYDSNSFLVNNNWYGAAARLSGSIIGLLQLPVQMQRADDVELLELRRRQALSMAVIARVHISYEQYLAAADVYRWASQLAEVDRQLYQQVSNRAETDAQGELERISAQTGAVSSELLRYRSYAEAQAALGRLYAALGVDTVSENEYLMPNATILRHALHEAQESAKAAENQKDGDKTAADAPAPTGAEPAKTTSAEPAQPPGAGSALAQEPQIAPDAQGRPSAL